MPDKRQYRRENINLQTTFFIQDADLVQNEFCGEILDISEVGIAIGVSAAADKEIAKHAAIGTTIQFSSMDDYDYFGTDRNALVGGTVTVERFIERDGLFVLGCSLNELSPELEAYIAEMKTIGFKKRGFLF